MVMLAQVYSRASDRWILCLWCAMHGQSRNGFEMHKIVVHEHDRSISCERADTLSSGGHVNYIFCSERHRRYFGNSHISMGNLPAGFGPTV